MGVVSYRLYCEGCAAETVIREKDLDSSEWSVQSIATNSGLCPSCNPTGDSESAESDSAGKELLLEELDHIGEKAAQNLREAGYETTDAIAEAEDSEILDVSWVGEKGLLSLKEASKQLEPQKRWDNE